MGALFVVLPHPLCTDLAHLIEHRNLMGPLLDFASLHYDNKTYLALNRNTSTSKGSGVLSTLTLR